MIQKTIETLLNEHVLNQANEFNSSILDLSQNSSLVRIFHPKLISAKIEYELKLSDDPPKIVIPDWHYACFESLNSAILSYPEIEYCFLGRPSNIARFLNDLPPEMIIDFRDYGSVVLSKKVLSPPPQKGLHQFLLPHWMEYVLSQELWGPTGKWRRFHQHLHGLFEELNLLSGEDAPGYYPLKSSASKVESKGILGSTFEDTYILVLPWCFGFKDLQKVDQIFRQEF